MKNQKSQIKQKGEPWKWAKNAKANKQEPCALILEIQAQLNEIVSPLEIFEWVTGFEELIDLIVVQTNLYAQQKGRIFTVDNNELKAFIEINYIMAINKLPTIAENWRVKYRWTYGEVQRAFWYETVCQI